MAESRKKPAKISTKQATRVCLRCQKKFPSSGPGNRICTVCGQANRNERGISTMSTARLNGIPIHD